MPFSEAADNPKISQPAPRDLVDVPAGEPTSFGRGGDLNRSSDPVPPQTNYWCPLSDQSRPRHSYAALLAQEGGFEKAASRLWFASRGGGIWRPAVVGRLPGLVRIIKLHALEDFQGIRAQILLVDDAIVTDNKRFHSGDTVLCRSGRKGKPSDHGTLDNKIHLAERGGRTLTF